MRGVHSYLNATIIPALLDHFPFGKDQPTNRLLLLADHYNRPAARTYPPRSGCGIEDPFCFEVDVSVDHVAVFKSSGISYSFALPAGTSELTVRALVDRNIKKKMEVFVAGGRAVSTYGCGAGGRICPARPVTAELGAWVTAVSAVTVNSRTAQLWITITSSHYKYDTWLVAAHPLYPLGRFAPSHPRTIQHQS